MGIALQAIGLLIVSNIFMTLAWYGHLGGENQPTWPPLAFLADLKNRPLMLAVVVSWVIAFVEYLFQVPANRIGSAVMTKSQLKIVQEVISLTVFVIMAVFYWKERVSWNYLLAGLCLVGAVVFIFRDGPAEPMTPAQTTAAETRQE